MVKEEDKKMIKEAMFSTKQITLGEATQVLYKFLFHDKIALINHSDLNEEQKSVARQFSVALFLSFCATMTHGDDINYNPDREDVRTMDDDGTPLDDPDTMN